MIKKNKSVKNSYSWFKSSKSSYSPLNNEVPWITYESIKWLKEFLDPEMKVFEYGSGGSTIFFARRVKELISIEHEKSWFDLLNQKIDEYNLNNVKYQLIIPTEKQQSSYKYSIQSFTSSEKADQHLSYENYVKSIDKFPDEYFDLVAIDGRARISSIANSISKIKDGGYLLLDNSEREVYESGINLLKKYDRTDFFGLGPSNFYEWMTSIWKIKKE